MRHAKYQAHPLEPQVLRKRDLPHSPESKSPAASPAAASLSEWWWEQSPLALSHFLLSWTKPLFTGKENQPPSESQSFLEVCVPGDILPTRIQSSRGSGFEVLYLALGTQDYSNLAVKSVKETSTEEYMSRVMGRRSRGDGICMHTADSLHCTAETNTAL